MLIAAGALGLGLGLRLFARRLRKRPECAAPAEGPLGEPLGHLGAQSGTAESYSPSLLFPVPRSLGRGLLELETAALPFHGDDVWNCYEASWLDAHGVPCRRVLELRVPCTSPNLVESKSLKLYLNSLNFHSFQTEARAIETIATDVAGVVGAPVVVRVVEHEPPLLDESQWSLLEGTAARGGCLPLERGTAPSLGPPDETLVRCLPEDAGYEVVRLRLATHLLRTLCPVTSQPDWGTVLIEYEGAPLDREGLLRYIVSLRREVGFHENAVERIYLALVRRCAPARLVVMGRFLRRGGIDINPVRCSSTELAEQCAAAPQPRVIGQ